MPVSNTVISSTWRPERPVAFQLLLREAPVISRVPGLAEDSDRGQGERERERKRKGESERERETPPSG